MRHVEMLQTPQRDWWVAEDGRVLGVYLAAEGAFEAAHEHARKRASPFGFSILSDGTTWRSLVFDHLEKIACHRGACSCFDDALPDPPLDAEL